jgi:hypothetical protein
MAVFAGPAMAQGTIKANPDSNVVIKPVVKPVEKNADADVHFRNCTEARAAGYSRMRVGQPGYARHLDRDNDGIACE